MTVFACPALYLCLNKEVKGPLQHTVFLGGSDTNHFLSLVDFSHSPRLFTVPDTLTFRSLTDDNDYG